MIGQPVSRPSTLLFLLEVKPGLPFLRVVEQHILETSEGFSPRNRYFQLFLKTTGGSV